MATWRCRTLRRGVLRRGWWRVVSSIAKGCLLLGGGRSIYYRDRVGYAGSSADVAEESLFEHRVIFLIGRWLLFAFVLFQNKQGLKGRMCCVCVSEWLIIHSFGFCTFRLLLLQYLHYGSVKMWCCINFAPVWGICRSMNISFGCVSIEMTIIEYSHVHCVMA